MIGFNLYFVPPETIDPLTGESLGQDEPVFLHLSYGTQREAEAAQDVLESLYGTGTIEIDVRANYGTTCPGEEA